ncbi:MAG: short-chain dehydrogenase/reductase [Candidatus Saccharibacteria bacterium]|nr:short-chain dehydrogenase/reductase [Candidatus Saccharibacteria bacterium]
MNTLIIGGTSGLGLEIAKKYKSDNGDVYVTGRRQISESGIIFKPFDLAAPELVQRINDFTMQLPDINRLVYAAGYFQEGRVTNLTESQIEEMINVGGRGLLYFVKAILDKQDKLDELITITSTSQWTPRQKEPIYNFVKAGAAHFSNAIAEDGRVGKVLVAGPAGMQTNFWDGVERDDIKDMLDPAWVAEEIINLSEEEYRYRFAKIMRQPARVEIVETR